MRFLPCILCSLILCTACLALAAASAGQTVWSGLTFSFTHPPLSTTQDDITPNVSLTRGPTRGLYNAAYEPGYLDGLSPEFTLWATEVNNPGAEVAATNWSNLLFEDWQTAYGAGGGLATNIIESNAVVYLTLDDIYLDLRFTNWAVGNAGGGAFAYQRAEPPAMEPSGDYSGNLVVDAADYTVWRDTLGQSVATPGDGADGDQSGQIDAPDYDYWKLRFGNTVPAGSAATSVVPEPLAITSIIGGLILLASTTRKRTTPRGPGLNF